MEVSGKKLKNIIYLAVGDELLVSELHQYIGRLVCRLLRRLIPWKV